jgi:hypothetical protein
MRVAPALLLVLLVGCTSAAVPGAQDVIDQADKAREVQVETALRQTVASLMAYNAEMGTFTTNVQELQTRYGLNISQGITITIPRADATTYCVQANDPELGDYHLGNTDPTMVQGPC